MSRKALILAAGLGTRLRPLTNDRPKALVEYKGIPMLEHVIRKLIRSGFKELIINIHHFPEQIIDFVNSRNSFGVRIEFSDEREKLLDTGGAIKHAGGFFDDKPFLVHNIDIFSNIDLEALYRFHLSHNPLATLAVKERVTSRSLLMGAGNRLCGWRNNRTGEEIITRKCDSFEPIAFSGIYILDPSIFKLFGEADRFSIIDTFLELATDRDILLYRHDMDQWTDMGKK
ncbi:MAG: nucleotidyltransferase family protein [Bacteroidales bacterium]|nr:nucleotidyltransferase family protein [Bacteroidales bacterium]